MLDPGLSGSGLLLLHSLLLLPCRDLLAMTQPSIDRAQVPALQRLLEAQRRVRVSVLTAVLIAAVTRFDRDCGIAFSWNRPPTVQPRSEPIVRLQFPS